jgi:hypothetical protein
MAGSKRHAPIANSIELQERLATGISSRTKIHLRESAT